MSNEIDWSEAPVWAQVIVTNEAGGRYYAEHFIDGKTSRRQGIDNRDDDSLGIRYGKGHSWKLSALRPAECNDKGMPTVGTVCEAQWKVPHKGDTRFHKCLIIHHASKGEAVAISLEADMDSCPFWVGLARPIRTAEQIAAEERQTAISQMRLDARNNNLPTLGHYEQCANLYDAGYRKVSAQ